MLPIDKNKFTQLKEQLIKVIPSYSTADPVVLSDYILALTKQSGATLKEIIDRFYGELASFLSNAATLPKFIDIILDNIRDLGVVSEQAFQEHLQSRGPIRDTSRRSARLAHPYQKSQQSQQSLQKKGEPTNKIKVTKLPKEVTESEDPEGMVGQWFSRFGSIGRVLLYPLERRADIEYETTPEQNGVECARQAVSNPEAAFGNRFVQIWQVRDEPKDEVIPEVAMIVKMSNDELQQRKEATMKAKLELQTKMEELARKQDEERRRLLQHLDAVNEDDKKAIMQSLGTVSSVIKDLPKVRHQDVTDLESVKSEREAMGMDGTSPALTEPVQHWRGASAPRGRGRGAPRGRGASTRGGRGGSTLSLDNRVRTLIVSPYTAELAAPVYMKPNNVPGPSVLLKHLHQFGYVEGQQPFDGGIYVKYSKRWEAEKCMNEGKSVAVSGGGQLPLNITWAESNEVVATKVYDPATKQSFQEDVEMGT